MGVKGKLTAEQALLRTRYVEGLAASRTRRSDDARVALAAALTAAPGDGPSTALLARALRTLRRPPA